MITKSPTVYAGHTDRGGLRQLATPARERRYGTIRLASDIATADLLTGGLTVFGVGRGYHTREVETLGGPMLDGEAKRELFDEQVVPQFTAR
jgi:alkanesulfonate monooxygenase SsuD/methylene tetrahydromethanopterin reductase-like flavin-dependent oxidoreductase (luciferase family)